MDSQTKSPAPFQDAEDEGNRPKPQRLRVSAYGVIVQHGRILLCQISEPNHVDNRKWTLPGGGLEFGEDPRAAAKREILEETGCVARLSEILDVNSLAGEVDGVEWHAIRILFRAELVSGTPRAEVDGTTDACAWFSADELMSIELVTLARAALQFM